MISTALRRLYVEASSARAPSGLREKAIIRAAQAGDRAAFASLVKRHHNAVCAVTYALTGRYGLSEDVAQEVFLIAWRRLGEFREDRSLKRWLIGIARKCSLNALRSRRGAAAETGLAGVSDELRSTEPSPLERAITRQEEEFVGRALGLVPEIYRLPLVLFYRESNSVREVAQALDTSEESVKMRLSRGRRLLEASVMQAVESFLRKTRSGPGFVIAVLAALGAEAGPAAASTPEGAADRWRPVRMVLALAASALLIGSSARDGGWMRRERSASAGAVHLAAPTAAPFKLASNIMMGLLWDRPDEEPRADNRREPLPVLGYDFEDGLLPDVFSVGHVVFTPGRIGNHHAAMATVRPADAGDIDPVFGLEAMTWRTAVVLHPENLYYREGLVLAFDYSLVESRWGFYVEIYDKDRQSNYHLDFKARRGRWTPVSIALSALHPNKDVGPMLPGDHLIAIKIMGGRVGGPPFLIDDVRLTDDGGISQ